MGEHSRSATDSIKETAMTTTNDTTTITSTYAILEIKKVIELVGFNLLPISRTDGKKGKSGLCIQVPVISDSVATVIYNDAIGQAWFRSQIAALQSKLASALNKDGKAVTSTDLGTTALLAAMVAVEAAERISKESIGKWFDDGMVTLITAALTAKGIPEGVAAKVIADFRASFQRLAVPDVTMSVDETVQLEKAMGLIAAAQDEDEEMEDSPMTEKLAARLVACIDRSAKLAGIANAL